MTKFWLVTFLVLSCSWNATADEVVGEGKATIERGDVASARELATRRAIARAVESRGAVISGQTVIYPGGALESAQVRATGCATQTTPLGEVIGASDITVSVNVSVANDGACTPVCRRTTLNKIAVTGFAMEFPGQVLMTERGSVAALTAVEMARFINQRHHLPAVFDSQFFPYESPATAPQQWSGGQARNLSTADFAQAHSAQYVLAGVYRDFGISAGLFARARRIEIEAFLHDGANGAVLARRKFSRTAKGKILLGQSGSIGSPQFYAGDLGRAWGALYADIAAWVDVSASCLPFFTTVLKVDDNRLHINAGAESGLSAGDTLSLHQWLEPPVRGENDQVLGREKVVKATVRIRSVYPNFSIGELVEALKGLKIVPGDVLYAE
jgi:hypothetical protein